MAPPERIGRFEIVGAIAHGGMGEVYLARVRGLGGFDRHVVLKTLEAYGNDDEEAEAMFFDEARVLGALHHHHIVPIYDLARDDGRLYMVMDYIHGHTTHEVWQRTLDLGASLPIDFALTVVAAAAAGLHYAHTRRGTNGARLHVVHRDVSLSNVMLGFDGGVKLIDFGIAKTANRSAKTQVGYVKGKLGYMAPEQLRGEPVDARTDVFALGIVLYELTTMRRTFREESDLATVERIKAGTFALPTTFVQDYPVELQRIVLRALKNDPRERYPDADTMRREIEALGHRLEMLLGDAAIAEIMTQLFEDQREPWQRLSTAPRVETELEVPLEVVSEHDLTRPATAPAPPTRPTPPAGRRRGLRTATEAVDALIVKLDTPPFGTPSLRGNTDLDAVTQIRDQDVIATIIREADTNPAGPRAPEVNATRSTTLPGQADNRRAPAPPTRPPVEARPTKLVHRQPRPISKGWVAAGIVIAAALAAIVASFVGDGPGGSAGGGSGGSERSGKSSGASGAVGVDAASPPDAPARPDAPATIDSAPAGDARTTIKLHIATMPPDATVILDGKRLGKSPINETIDAARGTHTLKIRRTGYVPVKLEVALDADLTREVTLQRAQ